VETSPEAPTQEQPMMLAVAEAPAPARVAVVEPAGETDDAPVAATSIAVASRGPEIAERARPRWGGGLSVLGLSGVGALPQVNLGLEVSGYLRRDQHFASLGVSRWVPQDAVNDGAGVEIKLDTFVARAGWGPSRLPLRAWGLGEVGEMTGMGLNLSMIQRGSARWVALGGGFGVAWQMNAYARVLGTFEVAVPLSRAQFMVAQGNTIYEPSLAAARAAFGFEVGWR
jgi:hypothetical protein